MEPNYTYKLLHSKGNHKQNKTKQKNPQNGRKHLLTNQLTRD